MPQLHSAIDNAGSCFCVLSVKAGEGHLLYSMDVVSKKNMRHIAIIFFLLLTVSKLNAQTIRPAAQGDSLFRVSIVKLLANPEKYHNKLVVIKGFLHHRFEDSGIYLTKEHSQLNSHENALWVRYDENVIVEPLKGGRGDLKNMDRKFVMIVGYLI